MASRAEPGTAPRAPLSRDRVLRTAITLADEGGIASLTMRKLARALAVEAMSLYHHVANKDALLDGMVDSVMSEVALPPGGADWKAAIRKSAISAHEVFLGHRWACGLMMAQAGVGPARLRWMDAVLGTLRAAGFSAALTCHAYHALDSHISGFTLWEASFPPAAELRDLAATVLRELPVDEYPHLAEHIEQHLTASGQDEEGEFVFGLDLLLDGLERLRGRA